MELDALDASTIGPLSSHSVSTTRVTVDHGIDGDAPCQFVHELTERLNIVR
jgi:hypothetical protein